MEKAKTLHFPISILPHERGKVMLLTALGFGVGVLAWYCVRQALGIDILHVTISDMWRLATAYVVLFLFLGLATMIGLLVADTIIAKVLMGILAASYFVWFPVSQLTLLAFLAIVLALLFYDWNIKGEMHDRISFSVAKIVRATLGLTLTLFIAAIALTLYARSLSDVGTPVSPITAFISGASATTNRVLASVVKGYSPDETLDEFLLRLALTQANTRGIASVPNKQQSSPFINQVTSTDTAAIVDRLPPDLRRQIEQNAQLKEELVQQSAPFVQEEIKQTREQFLKGLGVKADGSTTMSNLVHLVLAKQIEKFVGPYERFLPTLLALSLYFTLQIFSFIYSAAITLFAVALFWMLKSSRFAYVQTVSIPGKVATLSPDTNQKA